jgi:hypothetical protein
MITNVVIYTFDNCLENPPKGLDSRDEKKRKEIDRIIKYIKYID